MENIVSQNGVGFFFTQNSQRYFVAENLGEKFCNALQAILQKKGQPIPFHAIWVDAQKGTKHILEIYGQDAADAMTLCSKATLLIVEPEPEPEVKVEAEPEVEADTEVKAGAEPETKPKKSKELKTEEPQA